MSSPKCGGGSATQVLDGRALAARMRGELQGRAAALHERGVAPKLGVVRAGEDPGTTSYLATLERVAGEVGVDFELHSFAEDVGASELRSRIDALNRDNATHGILLQSPLPAEVAAYAHDWIDPAKDVDGASTDNTGKLFAGRPSFVPATAGAVMALIDEAGVEVSGALAVVVGRSVIVGKPAALLLLARDATVTVCHSRTHDLPRVTSSAGILVVAVGRPSFIGPEHVKEGAVVIDVGINVVGAGIVGDVDPASSARAGALSPVPGGVGPVTTTILLRQTIEAAEAIMSGH